MSITELRQNPFARLEGTTLSSRTHVRLPGFAGDPAKMIRGKRSTGALVEAVRVLTEDLTSTEGHGVDHATLVAGLDENARRIAEGLKSPDVAMRSNAENDGARLIQHASEVFSAQMQPRR